MGIKFFLEGVRVAWSGAESVSEEGGGVFGGAIEPRAVVAEDFPGSSFLRDSIKVLEAACGRVICVGWSAVVDGRSSTGSIGSSLGGFWSVLGCQVSS